jgi:hypothetical protein
MDMLKDAKWRLKIAQGGSRNDTIQQRKRPFLGRNHTTDDTSLSHPPR